MYCNVLTRRLAGMAKLQNHWCKDATRCNKFRLLIFSKQLYMATGSNIGALYRKLYIQSKSVPKDGRVSRPKHVELISKAQWTEFVCIMLVGRICCIILVGGICCIMPVGGICCIMLVGYIFVLLKHGLINIKSKNITIRITNNWFKKRKFREICFCVKSKHHAMYILALSTRWSRHLHAVFAFTPSGRCVNIDGQENWHYVHSIRINER